RAELMAWLGGASGRIVLIDAVPTTCRPPSSWEEWGGEEALQRAGAEADSAAVLWARRVAGAGVPRAELIQLLAEAGVAALMTVDWTQGWGVSRVHGSANDQVPMIRLSCEDYGLLFRLAER